MVREGHLKDSQEFDYSLEYGIVNIYCNADITKLKTKKLLFYKVSNYIVSNLREYSIELIDCNNFQFYKVYHSTLEAYSSKITSINNCKFYRVLLSNVHDLAIDCTSYLHINKCKNISSTKRIDSVDSFNSTFNIQAITSIHINKTKDIDLFNIHAEIIVVKECEKIFTSKKITLKSLYIGQSYDVNFNNIYSEDLIIYKMNKIDLFWLKNFNNIKIEGCKRLFMSRWMKGFDKIHLHDIKSLELNYHIYLSSCKNVQIRNKFLAMIEPVE
jgi:hypothetical protein